MGTKTIKRPLPYQENHNQRSFKAGEVILPGDLVVIHASGGTLQRGSALDDERIGIALYDPAYVADSGTEYYAKGVMVPVKLRGDVLEVEFTTTATNQVYIGDFVKMAASGGVGAEATGTTKTLNSIGIALTASGTTGGTLEIVSL